MLNYYNISYKKGQAIKANSNRFLLLQIPNLLNPIYIINLLDFSLYLDLPFISHNLDFHLTFKLMCLKN